MLISHLLSVSVCVQGSVVICRQLLIRPRPKRVSGVFYPQITQITQITQMDNAFLAAHTFLDAP